MTDNNEPVKCNIDNLGIATLTLNKPHKHNAFDDIMIKNLIENLQALRRNGKVKVLILNAEGLSFSAGGDLGWMKKMAHYTWDENLADAKALGQLMYTLYHFGKPTIALIQGAAYGGGVGLAACCQIAIAAKNTTFCFSETKLGLIPAVISPYIIHAIGPRLAKAYFLTAEVFSAQRAYDMGLCVELVEHEEALLARGEEIAHALLKNGQHALQAAHQLVEKMQHLPLTENIINLTAEEIAKIRSTSEAQEGLSAFLEKRQPNWS